MKMLATSARIHKFSISLIVVAGSALLTTCSGEPPVAAELDKAPRVKTCAIDSVTIKDGAISGWGWGYIDSSTAPDKIFLAVRESLIPGVIVNRADVAKAASGGAPEMVGFEITNVKVDALQPNDKVVVVLEKGGNKFVCKLPPK